MPEGMLLPMAARRRITLVTLITSALAGGILTGAVAQAAPAGPPRVAPPTSPAAPQSRPSEVHTVSLPDRAAALKAGPSATAAPTTAVFPSIADSGEQNTAGFSLVGIS